MRDRAPPFLQEIAANAMTLDTHDADPSEEIRLLEREGWLTACLPENHGGNGWGSEPSGTGPALTALRRLGRANLSLARLFEGHMNAVKLLWLYADADLQKRSFGAVREGSLLGVWGADLPTAPLTFECAEDNLRLGGVKQFASGLQSVDHAIVTASTDAGLQLLLAPTAEDDRSDPTHWRMAGMRASRSGHYDFSELEIPRANLVGEPGDYLREPHFEGGIWRYCAAHLGGAEALFDAMRDMLVEKERADDPHQQRRIVECACAVETARLWLIRAASKVEAPGASPNAATHSLLAREITEQCCRMVIDRTRQALGMAAHVEGSKVEMICRDLSLFLCQAAPDAKRARAAEALVASGARVEDL